MDGRIIRLRDHDHGKKWPETVRLRARLVQFDACVKSQRFAFLPLFLGRNRCFWLVVLTFGVGIKEGIVVNLLFFESTGGKMGIRLVS